MVITYERLADASVRLWEFWKTLNPRTFSDVAQYAHSSPVSGIYVDAAYHEGPSTDIQVSSRDGYDVLLSVVIPQMGKDSKGMIMIPQGNVQEIQDSLNRGKRPRDETLFLRNMPEGYKVKRLRESGRVNHNLRLALHKFPVSSKDYPYGGIDIELAYIKYGLERILEEQQKKTVVSEIVVA